MTQLLLCNADGDGEIRKHFFSPCGRRGKGIKVFASVCTNVIKTVKGQRKRRARYTEQNGEKCMTKEQTKSA